ncbi:MAG: hypothetical protein FRX49_07502 [Trebouxia sp. A1-2]|nr:MAG: hypothetical protein FRX49_07502 [Trebouxia sp. A1-2]
MASTARNRTRVILHVDLDAFYCQVEMKRVGIPAHIPCAVQQWEGLIAVNYPARAAGITRHMRRAEAKAKCPELQCVHVETIGGDAGAGNDSAVTWEDRKTQKACLERYRVASAEIIAVFHEVAPDAIVEKASIDEAYLDVTSIVDVHLQARRAATCSSTCTLILALVASCAFLAVESSASGYSHCNATACDGESSLLASSAQLPPLESPGCGNHVIGGALDLGSEFERRLAVGGQLACQLRAAVKDKLGYTCSAGVACNKLMAKIASAMHEPNQQTVIPPRAVPDLMKDMPLKKIRNFGGKLGAELQALGCSTAGDVLAFAPATLHQHFGERAPWILYTVQGNSDEPVQVKERPKSMLAAKSFEPTSDMAALERWVTILAEELAERMAADNKLFNRRPKSLHLHYRGGGGGGWGSGDRSKSSPMPRFLKAGPTAPVICEAVMRLFQKCPDAMPCTRLAVAASDFEDGPLSEDQGSITKFLSAGSGKPTWCSLSFSFHCKACTFRRMRAGFAIPDAVCHTAIIATSCVQDGNSADQANYKLTSVKSHKPAVGAHSTQEIRRYDGRAFGKPAIGKLRASYLTIVSTSTGKGEVSMSSQPAAVPFTSTKSASGLRSKQAAVASMFKAAKASTTSSATTAAAPVNAASSSTALQRQDSRDDSAMPDTANAVSNREAELLLGTHHAVATDMTPTPSPAADVNFSRLKRETNCQPSTDAAQHVQDDAGPPDCEEDSNVAEQVSINVKDGQTFTHVPNCSDEQCNDAHAAPGNSLSNVDVAEQKQIMHDLWLEKNALSSRSAAKRPAPANKTSNKRSKLAITGKSKQTQLSAMLKKVPPP